VGEYEWAGIAFDNAPKYWCMKPPISDRINDALGLSSFEESVEAMSPTVDVVAPVPTDEIAPVCVATGDPERDADADLQYARQNLRVMQEKAQEAVDACMDFARQSDNPKAYEALAQILQAGITASTALMGVNKTRTDIRLKSGKDGSVAPNVNNTAVVITTTDLLKMVRESNEVIDAEI
jgi:hypothetical protein